MRQVHEAEDSGYKDDGERGVVTALQRYLHVSAKTDFFRDARSKCAHHCQGEQRNQGNLRGLRGLPCRKMNHAQHNQLQCNKAQR